MLSECLIDSWSATEKIFRLKLEVDRLRRCCKLTITVYGIQSMVYTIDSIGTISTRFYLVYLYLLDIA